MFRIGEHLRTVSFVSGSDSCASSVLVVLDESHLCRWITMILAIHRQFKRHLLILCAFNFDKHLFNTRVCMILPNPESIAAVSANFIYHKMHECAGMDSQT